MTDLRAAEDAAKARAADMLARAQQAIDDEQYRLAEAILSGTIGVVREARRIAVERGE